jgi:hypothetical protein
MGQEPTEDRRAFIITATLLAALLLAALLAQLPPTSMPESLSRRAASFGLLWPQGWSFFSEVAHQDRTVAYRVLPDGALTTEDSLQARPGSWWGLRRTTYFRMVETEYIAARIPPSSWITCDAPAAALCLRRVDESAPAAIDNPFHASDLCGPVFFTVERPDLGSDRLQRGDVPRGVVAIAPVSVRCASGDE